MQAPDWPTCGHAGGHDRCIGIQVDGFDRCLAHLEPDLLDQALLRLHSSADLDARGTPISAELLTRILRAVQGQDERPTFGRARFSRAQFTGDPSFRNARFTGDASFRDAHFTGDASFRDARFALGAWFSRAQFTGDASFRDAHFAQDASFRDVHFTGEAMFSGARFALAAWFSRAQFVRTAWFSDARFTRDARFDHVQFAAAFFSSAQFIGAAGFDHAQFTGAAWFIDAQFKDAAGFDHAQFTGTAWFSGAQFIGAAGFSGTRLAGAGEFSGARFETATSLGPLAAASLSVDRAVFVGPVMIEAAANAVSCRDTTWSAGVTLRLRYAEVDLERATFTVPSFVTGSDQPFEPSVGPLDESEIRNHVLHKGDDPPDLWVPTLTSLRGSDSANLSVTDVDLSHCRFAGARLLDEVRLEGRCVFDHPPQGFHTSWAWPPIWRWSNRQSLAEERTWRTTTRKYARWSKARSSEPAEVGPERLAGLYRQLRKAQEDAKNEPGAADFYYGEMEMRRHSITTPAAERTILWLYWLLSGYGLRAVRALAALGILAVITTTALTAWGLAASAPPQNLTGIITSSAGNRARINATLNTATPQLPSAGQRWTAPRARTALEVTLDSIVFRATDQPLTTAGIWTTDIARILGPVLLALALLAVRNRVKR